MSTLNKQPLVAVIMGSKSDWDIMKNASDMLDEFAIEHDCLVVSAHRTPDWLAEFSHGAEEKGYQVIIAGAGGAAHLPGMVASHTALPVIGVPIPSRYLKGMDSLLSIVQMPGGIPVATMAIGESGAKNAAIMAARILSLSNPSLKDKLINYQNELRENVEKDKVIR